MAENDAAAEKKDASVAKKKSEGEKYASPGKSPFHPFALVVILVLVVGGYFLMTWLRDTSKMQDCIMAGRKNCAPIDP